jgi:hypothetical protein
MPILIISYTHLCYIYVPHDNDGDDVSMDYKVGN